MKIQLIVDIEISDKFLAKEHEWYSELSSDELEGHIENAVSSLYEDSYDADHYYEGKRFERMKLKIIAKEAYGNKSRTKINQ